MPDLEAEALLEELEAVLAEERAALGSASFERLGQTLKRKTELVERLRSAKLPSDKLDRASREARHNALLLRSAAEGLGSALRRVRQIRRGHRSFSSYGAAGESLSIGPSAPGLERRA